MVNINSEHNDAFQSKVGETGGNQKSWNTDVNRASSYTTKRTPQYGEDAVKQQYELIEKTFNVLEAPMTLNPKKCTVESIYLNAVFIQRKKRKQVIKLLRYRRFMEKHKIPVDFSKIENTAESFEEVAKHFRHREIIEFDGCKKGLGTGALHNEWAVIRMHLDAYRIPHGKGTIWNYKLPPKPNKDRKSDIPTPRELHAMLQAKYSAKREVDAMCKTILICNFYIGWRFPSEAYEAKITDIDFDRKEILVHSQNISTIVQDTGMQPPD